MNLLTDSRENRRVLLLSSARAVRAMAVCKSFFAKLFLSKRVFW